jgi:DNA repair exonuclease SbcCD ATPase subunit
MTAPLAETIARLDALVSGPHYDHRQVGMMLAPHLSELRDCARRCEAIDGVESRLDDLRAMADSGMSVIPGSIVLNLIDLYEDAAAERDALAKRVGELEYVAGYQADLEAIRKTLDACDAPHDCEEGVSLEPTRIRLMAAEADRLRAENERLAALNSVVEEQSAHVNGLIVDMRATLTAAQDRVKELEPLAKLQWDVARALGMMHEPDNAAEWPASVEQLLGGVAALKERAEKAEKNYRFMVERAADEKLDGYRELGQRAADAENQRDNIQRALAAAQERVRELEAQLSDRRDPLLHELAELRDRVQSVIERGPRFTDGPMESAADSVVEELRAVLDKGERPSCIPADCQHYEQLPSGLWAWVEGDVVRIECRTGECTSWLLTKRHKNKFRVSEPDFLAARALGVRVLGWAK